MIKYPGLGAFLRVVIGFYEFYFACEINLFQFSTSSGVSFGELYFLANYPFDLDFSGICRRLNKVSSYHCFNFLCFLWLVIFYLCIGKCIFTFSLIFLDYVHDLVFLKLVFCFICYTICFITVLLLYLLLFVSFTHVVFPLSVYFT